MTIKTIEYKKQYTFGDCIPESKKIYRYFRHKGYNPKMVEGWAEVDNNINILPDYDFLFYYYPTELEKVNKNINYNDYPKAIQHTWVEVNGHIIDITKNQFNKYRGIIKYYIGEKYFCRP